jgi:hypothetical protein
MPPSRPSLDVELQLEQLREDLKRLDDRLERKFDVLFERLYELNVKLARQSGYQSAANTGSFHLPPVTVNVEQAKTSKRPSSLPPGLFKLISDPKVIAAALTALAVASHFVRSCAIGH